MAKRKIKTDISKLSFEQAITSLTEVVQHIERGDIPLEESIQQYERGMGLIQRCREILQDAEKRIEKIAEKQDSGADGDDTSAPAKRHKPDLSNDDEMGEAEEPESLF